MSELTDSEWNGVQADLRGALNDFRSTYSDDANDNEVVKETDEYAVFADGSGQEINEVAEIVGVDRRALSERMHEEARSLTDYNWGVVDPVVIYKE